MSTLIKFNRNSAIEENRHVAMIRLLNKDFRIGEPAIISYYRDSSHSIIDTIFAIGVKNGNGKDSFEVISTGEFGIVVDVVDQLPDVSSLVHGEVYLYVDSYDRWNYVYLSDNDSRVIEPITSEKKTFISLKDNNFYVSGEDGKVRNLNEVYTQEEIDKLIAKIKIEFDIDEIRNRLNLVEFKAENNRSEIVKLWDTIKEIEEKGTSVAIIANLHSKLKSDLIKVQGEDHTNIWFINSDLEEIGGRGIVGFPPDSLEFKVLFSSYEKIDYDGTELGEIIYISDQNPNGTYIEPTDDGTYKNCDPVLFHVDDDNKQDITFKVETFKAAHDVTSSISLYGLRGARYIGRTNADCSIFSYMIKDTDYNWENLKEKHNIDIDYGNEYPYFAYAYPKAWGELDKIYTGSFILYDKNDTGLTFKKMEKVINNVDYLVYIYNNPNKDSMVNLNFE